MIARLIRGIERSTRAVNVLSMVTIALIMVITVAGIVLRVSGFPFSGFTNLSESLLVIAVYLGLAYAQQRKQHVSVELLMASLGEKAREVFTAFNLIAALAICSLILYTSWDYALDAWRIRERMDGAPFFPIYPPKFAIALGIAFLWLQLAADLLRQLFALFPRKGPVHGMLGDHRGGAGPGDRSAPAEREPL